MGRDFSNALLTSLTLALLRADPLHPGNTPVRDIPLGGRPSGSGVAHGCFGDGEPTPGVTVVVYEDFFAKASSVAIQLLKVSQGVE
jgi:hypothetical protein